MTTHEFELNGINYYVEGEYIPGDDVTMELPSYNHQFAIFESDHDGEETSNCCGAPAWHETDICSDCREHADIQIWDENGENPLNDEQLEQYILREFYDN